MGSGASNKGIGSMLPSMQQANQSKGGMPPNEMAPMQQTPTGGMFGGFPMQQASMVPPPNAMTPMQQTLTGGIPMQMAPAQEPQDRAAALYQIQMAQARMNEMAPMQQTPTGGMFGGFPMQQASMVPPPNAMTPAQEPQDRAEALYQIQMARAQRNAMTPAQDMVPPPNAMTPMQQTPTGGMFGGFPMQQAAMQQMQMAQDQMGGIPMQQAAMLPPNAMTPAQEQMQSAQSRKGGLPTQQMPPMQQMSPAQRQQMQGIPDMLQFMRNKQRRSEMGNPFSGRGRDR